jgi:nicotinic acid mononucleotide adenylyltransferase
MCVAVIVSPSHDSSIPRQSQKASGQHRLNMIRLGIEELLSTKNTNSEESAEYVKEIDTTVFKPVFADRWEIDQKHSTNQKQVKDHFQQSIQKHCPYLNVNDQSTLTQNQNNLNDPKLSKVKAEPGERPDEILESVWNYIRTYKLYGFAST